MNLHKTQENNKDEAPNHGSVHSGTGCEGNSKMSEATSKLYFSPAPSPITGTGFEVVPLSCLLFGVLCPAGYPGCNKTPPGPPANLGEQRNLGLALANDYRRQHCTPPMAVDLALQADAQKYAEYLASTGLFLHSTPNLAKLPPPSYTIANDNGFWYGEKPVYCPAQPQMTMGNIDQFGHFTQMVWKSSTLVGYGSAVGKDGYTIVVARYKVAGNDPYKATANVQCTCP